MYWLHFSSSSNNPRRSLFPKRTCFCSVTFPQGSEAVMQLLGTFLAFVDPELLYRDPVRRKTNFWMMKHLWFLVKKKKGKKTCFLGQYSICSEIFKWTMICGILRFPAPLCSHCQSAVTERNIAIYWYIMVCVWSLYNGLLVMTKRQPIF